MTDDNFLAFQCALGLLSTKEKQAIKKTVEFDQALQQWQLQLTKLNRQAPLEKKSVARVWQKINIQIKPKKHNIIQNWLTSWRYLLSGSAAFGLLLSIGLLNQTANAQLGWDIDTNLSIQQLSITATTHQHMSPSNQCTLWVKKDGKVLRIGLMPEKGQKIFNINTQMLSMISGGEMIISLEDKNNPSTSPTVINYQYQWKV